MEKDRKFRALAIAAICVAIVGVSVAYAALSATLNITGDVTVKDNQFNVKWTSKTNIQTTGEATVTKDVTIADSESQKITWAADFNMPGDSITFTATLKNVGNVPARLAAETESTKYITGGNAAFEYTVTVDGADISTKAGKILNSTQEKVVTVTVTLPEDTEVATFNTIKGQKFTFGLDLPFTQAGSTDITTGSELF